MTRGMRGCYVYFVDKGVEEYFKDKQCVTVIEWADRVRDIWPKECIQIYFKILKGDSRELRIIN